MNKVHAIGRLTRDPEVKTGGLENAVKYARYTLAVDRRTSNGGADFIPMLAFGRAADFAEKYLKKGMKIAVTGHIQTGSYTNKDGVKVYTFEVVVEDQEFAGSKASGATNNEPETSSDGFTSIPEGMDEEMPFH